MSAWIKSFIFCVLFPISLTQASANGGITVGGTRIIYDGGKKEASLSVTNSDSNPYLIQSWAETQSGGADKAPFIVTPPLFRLDGGQQNLLRIVRTGDKLPEDRESLYWLNVKSIPGTDKEGNSNSLQIAVKTRIKLIFRPASLKGVPEDVADSLIWTQHGNRITVRNPTPFIMNFKQVRIGGNVLKGVTYVLPKSEATFVVPAGVGGKVNWKLISDYGGTGAEHSSQR